MWLTVGNALSLFRLLLGPVFPFLPGPWRVPLFLAGAISDALDGAVSRVTHTSSDLGRMLDPIADKIFVLGVFVALVLDGTLTLEQAALLALRDLAVAVCAGWMLWRRKWSQALAVQPSLLGKLTTALLFLALLVILWQGEVSLWVFVPTVIVSGLAGLDYLRRSLRREQRV